MASKESAEESLAWKTEEVVAGETVPASSSGESHCVVTKGNMAACGLEARREMIVHGYLVRFLVVGGSGNRAADENCREGKLDHTEPLNRTSPVVTRAVARSGVG